MLKVKYSAYFKGNNKVSHVLVMVSSSNNYSSLKYYYCNHWCEDFPTYMYSQLINLVTFISERIK